VKFSKALALAGDLRVERPEAILRDAAMMLLAEREVSSIALAGLKWKDVFPHYVSIVHIHRGLERPSFVPLTKDCRSALALLRGSTSFGNPTDAVFCSVDNRTYGHPLTRESITRILTRYTQRQK